MKEAVAFNGLKVFSATKALDRDQLGERITEWIRSNPQATIVDKVITQSSDNEFHCLAITLFFNEDLTKRVANGVQQESSGAPTQGRGAVGSAPHKLAQGKRP